jgi:hypothetical protein
LCCSLAHLKSASKLGSSSPAQRGVGCDAGHPGPSLSRSVEKSNRKGVAGFLNGPSVYLLVVGNWVDSQEERKVTADSLSHFAEFHLTSSNTSREVGPLSIYIDSQKHCKKATATRGTMKNEEQQLNRYGCYPTTNSDESRGTHTQICVNDIFYIYHTYTLIYSYLLISSSPQFNHRLSSSIHYSNSLSTLSK